MGSQRPKPCMNKWNETGVGYCALKVDFDAKKSDFIFTSFPNNEFK